MHLIREPFTRSCLWFARVIPPVAGPLFLRTAMPNTWIQSQQLHKLPEFETAITSIISITSPTWTAKPQLPKLTQISELRNTIPQFPGFRPSVHTSANPVCTILQTQIGGRRRKATSRKKPRNRTWPWQPVTWAGCSQVNRDTRLWQGSIPGSGHAKKPASKQASKQSS